MLLAHLQLVVRPLLLILVPDRFSARRDINVEDTGPSTSTSRVSNIHDTFSLPCGTSSEPSFRQRLASCFVDNDLTHVQGNNILSLLRTHSCFSKLPRDVRTLVSTPRNPVVPFVVEPGEYIYFELEAEIIKSLPNTLSVSFVRQLELDFHTDGCTLDKSGSIHIWPVQCRISNIPRIKPIVVSIYKGSQKPHDLNIFFEKFIADVRAIVSNGGINFHSIKLPVRLRCFIADASARAFVLNHRGHMSIRPCSKCTVCGTLHGKHYAFDGINQSPRTDEDYIRRLDQMHHEEGTSPLSSLPMGIVSQVPFEYMYLVCLGVVKKLLSAWVHGDYSPFSKLRRIDISILSARLKSLSRYCPSDFARRPRAIELSSKYKATEFRQFLLYTGPVKLNRVLEKTAYKHFLLLHAAIRVLVSESPSIPHLSFAELALQKFVLRNPELYGPAFNSYNVHGFLHLTNDVRRLGNLDSCSAFRYANNMSISKKYHRKPHFPLQQFSNRMREIQFHGTNIHCNVNFSIRVSRPLNNDPACSQYRKIEFNSISLGINVRDNCCISVDGSIYLIFNINMDSDNSYRLGIKQFLGVDDFYDIGIISSALGVYKCATWSQDILYISPDQVRAKCFRMLFHDNMPTGNNDDPIPLETRSYVVAVITHSEKP
ncbi:uncharacterized protein LOC143372216 [Andrena cerasifolii]|uniref:uncharacterized protein LOC143372216 n=1 Tax=Andrena cerasifolii TaxID=2819439 RepID=UPI004037A278